MPRHAPSANVAVAGSGTARLAGTIVYFTIVAPLAWRFGLSGAAAAFVIGTSVLVGANGFQLWREYRRVRAS